MRVWVRIAVVVSGLGALPVGLVGQNAAGSEDMAAHRAALIAQCPAVPSPVNAKDLPIHVTTWGSGPAVLLIHGGAHGNIGGGPATFMKQQALAAMGWKVELFDRPGFGQSPSRGVDDMVADSIWIAKDLGDGANLIGHSFGGAESLLAAARRPGAVKSLILVEPGLAPMLATDPESANDPRIKKANAASAGVLMGAKTPADFALATVNLFGTDDHGGPSFATIAMREHPESAAGLGCAILQAHFATGAEMRAAADTVVETGIPVLVITGGYNPGRDASDEAIARILHAKYVVVKSPNHFVQQSNPEEFNRVVDEFMRKAGAAASGSASPR